MLVMTLLCLLISKCSQYWCIVIWLLPPVSQASYCIILVLWVRNLMDLRAKSHHWHRRWRNILIDDTSVFVIICRLVKVQDLQGTIRQY